VKDFSESLSVWAASLEAEKIKEAKEKTKTTDRKHDNATVAISIIACSPRLAC